MSANVRQSVRQPPTRPIESPVLTIPEAAAYLNVTRWTVRRWVSQRRLTVIKMGPDARSPVRLRRTDLDAFLTAHERPASPLWRRRSA